MYLAHPLDKQYQEEGARMHRELFHNAFNLLRTRAFVDVEMPSMGRMNLLHQPEHQRYVVHLLYASPIQKGSVKVIEDFPPLFDIPVTVDLPQSIKKAYLIPSGEELELRRQDGKLSLTVPKMICHTAVVLEY